MMVKIMIMIRIMIVRMIMMGKMIAMIIITKTPSILTKTIIMTIMWITKKNNNIYLKNVSLHLTNIKPPTSTCLMTTSHHANTNTHFPARETLKPASARRGTAALLNQLTRLSSVSFSRLVWLHGTAAGHCE